MELALRASSLLPVTGVVIVCVVLLWLLSLWRKDVSIVDVWWAPGFCVILALLVTGENSADNNLRLHLLWALVTIWSLRLGLHLLRRNLRHGEDKRYRKWREESSYYEIRSLFSVFLLQGALQLVIALPFYAVAAAERSLWWLDIVGFAFVLFGIGMEAIADWQLTRFQARADSRGKVMDEGLWAYSRHPNYFGNAVLWTGIGIVGTAAAMPPWFWAGPALMIFLLLRVSGVALLERDISERRPGYRDYIRRVSAFVPMPAKPKSPANS